MERRKITDRDTQKSKFMSYKPERAEIGTSAWRQDLANVTRKILQKLKLKHLHVRRWEIRINFLFFFLFHLLGFVVIFRCSAIPSFCVLGLPQNESGTRSYRECFLNPIFNTSSRFVCKICPSYMLGILINKYMILLTVCNLLQSSMIYFTKQKVL